MNETLGNTPSGPPVVAADSPARALPGVEQENPTPVPSGMTIEAIKLLTPAERLLCINNYRARTTRKEELADWELREVIDLLRVERTTRSLGAKSKSKAPTAPAAKPIDIVSAF